jgi:SWI/SNF related-matrix-associated actin-dependent regulator of chromatin subfamily C
MSTPKISLRVASHEPEISGDVVAQDIPTATGKEREKEPIYGGQLANISEGMAVDAPSNAAGVCFPPR